MQINLSEDIDNDIAKVRQMFIDIGWELEDDNYLVLEDKESFTYVESPISPYPPEHSESGDPYKEKRYKTLATLQFLPELLSYYNKGQSGKNYTSTIWIRCTAFPKENELDDTVELFKKEFAKLPIKPFHDEDAFRNYFQKEWKENFKSYRLSFFLNPHYPEGWWENHAL